MDKIIQLDKKLRTKHTKNIDEYSLYERVMYDILQMKLHAHSKWEDELSTLQLETDISRYMLRARNNRWIQSTHDIFLELAKQRMSLHSIPKHILKTMKEEMRGRDYEKIIEKCSDIDPFQTSMGVTLFLKTLYGLCHELTSDERYHTLSTIARYLEKIKPLLDEKKTYTLNREDIELTVKDDIVLSVLNPYYVTTKTVYFRMMTHINNILIAYHKSYARELHILKLEELMRKHTEDFAIFALLAHKVGMILEESTEISQLHILFTDEKQLKESELKFYESLDNRAKK